MVGAELSFTLSLYLLELKPVLGPDAAEAIGRLLLPRLNTEPFLLSQTLP